MALPPEVEAAYATIIDSILAASDLNTISEKRIRKGLQQAVEYDITPQKAAIKELIMARFDKFNAEKNLSPKVEEVTISKPLTNGHTATVKEEEAPAPVQQISSPPSKTHPPREERDEDAMSDVIDTPPKKKRKAEPLDDDALFAARLQAEENSRARPTRGGTSRKGAIVKKKRSPVKKKTAKKIKSEDDSDIEGSGSEVEDRKVNRSGGFHKPMALSAALSVLLDGETTLSRPQTVKRIWAYVREKDLQDPNDKRQIRCDEPMRAVFKQDKIHMFTMNKILSQNLYNPDE
ncbi:MAG: hypothetical protein M1830_009579 [Pleopsidium flavum]|nr:MAG: hypothetical protein M1830_009579 [Pleopsidium flavum]